MTKYGGKFKPNWIVYTQNIYPSLRNEFTTRSTTRPGFNNGFWRDSITERVALTRGPNLFPSGAANSFGVGSANGIPFASEGDAAIIPPSHSSWPLDASVDFLTRSGPIDYSLNDAGRITFSYSRRRMTAGELQNQGQYSQGSLYAEPGSGNPGLTPYQAKTKIYRWPQFILSPQYARTHMLSSPRSVVSPAGILIPETGAVPSTPSAPAFSGIAPGGFGGAEFRTISASDPYSGEALWEAPRNAGINRKVGSESKYLINDENA